MRRGSLEFKVFFPGQSESSASLSKSDNLVLEAIKSGTLMLRLVACCVCWITCTFLFYGLTLNSVSLVAGNNYLDFILTGTYIYIYIFFWLEQFFTALVEIPAYFACNFIVDQYGRKKTLVYSYLLTGGACLAFVFIPPSKFFKYSALKELPSRKSPSF